MPIRTSDGITINDFAQFRTVAIKVQKSKDIERVAKKENRGQITYNGQSIGIRLVRGHRTWTDIRNDLGTQIPNVLDSMRTYSLKGEVYCERDRGTVFREKFAGCLNFLLTWAKSVQGRGNVEIPVNVTLLQVRSIIKWTHLVMKEYESEFSEDDFVCVEGMI
jgi:hypothetical protein